jgi:cytosine deaminase
MSDSDFLELAIAEAKKGLEEGGIPIGSVLVVFPCPASLVVVIFHFFFLCFPFLTLPIVLSSQVIDGQVVGRGHNRRVQRGSVILHAEMDCLENAGRMFVILDLFAFLLL